MTEARSVSHATALMTAGTALSRLTGLVRIATLTYALGVTGTRLADTYNLANTTPNIIYELLLGGILTSVFVPALVAIRGRGTGDASALVSMSLVALAVVTVLAAVGAPVVMRLYTFRVEDPETRRAQLELATFLLRWFAPQILFYGLAAIAQALLNVRGRFGPPSFAPVLNNLVVIATFLAFAELMGERGLHLSTGAKVLLGAGTTAGVVVQALILLPSLRADRIRFRWDVHDPAVTRVLHLSVYVLGYVVVNQIGYWIVLALANREPGGVTAYQVAYIFFLLPHSLFAVSLHTALFPNLSASAAAPDWDSYREGFSFGVRGVAYLLLPAAAGYLVLADPVTRLILVRGLAGEQDAALIASVLQSFAFGLLFFSGFQFLTRCFYALPDTRTPTAVNAVAVLVNVVANLGLYGWLGVRGLAMGHALGYTSGAVLLLVVLHRRVPGGLGLRRLVGPVLRIAGVTAAMAACVWALARAMPDLDALVVIVGVGAGAILYVAFSLVAGLPERSIVMDLVPWRPRR